MDRPERDLFSVENHRLVDDKIHATILDGGDHEAVQAIGDAVAREIGLTEAEIAALHAPLPAKGARSKRLRTKFDPDQPRDEDGKWTDGGGSGGGDAGTGGGGTGAPALISPKPAEFIEARDKSSRQHYLSPLKPEDLSDHTLLTTEDKTAGVAIDPQGDLQNLF